MKLLKEDCLTVEPVKVIISKNSKTKVQIYCKECKHYFEQTPECHITRGFGCKVCGDKRGVKARNIKSLEI